MNGMFQYPRDVRDRIGAAIRNEGWPMTGREMTVVARVLGVCVRALWNWAKDCVDVTRAPVGRPVHDDAARRRALKIVAQQQRLQGRSVGWESVQDAVGDEVPTRLIQDSLRVLKSCQRKGRAKWLERRRQHIEVKGKDVVWSGDGLHLATADDGTKVKGEIVRDVATTKTLDVSVGPPVTGEDMVGSLERSREQRGTLPLVLGLDNGPENRADVLTEYCEQNHVVVLFNVPHTPQHNAASERGMRDYRGEMDLRSNEVGAIVRELNRARHILDYGRRRPSRGYLTAAQCDQTMPAASTLADRGAFYAAARTAIARAERDEPKKRARARAVREAILQTMENFNLIKRTRGGAPKPHASTERIT